MGLQRGGTGQSADGWAEAGETWVVWSSRQPDAIGEKSAALTVPGLSRGSRARSVFLRLEPAGLTAGTPTCWRALPRPEAFRTETSHLIVTRRPSLLSGAARSCPFSVETDTC